MCHVGKSMIKTCQLPNCGKEISGPHNKKYCGNQNIKGSCAHKASVGYMWKGSYEKRVHPKNKEKLQQKLMDKLKSLGVNVQIIEEVPEAPKPPKPPKVIKVAYEEPLTPRELHLAEKRKHNSGIKYARSHS